jgi:hypothetical protein
MFDFIRNNKKITQIFLALITLPFAFWGVDSYVRNAEVGAGVATVGGAKITRQELQSAMREQEDRMRAQLGGKVDPAMFETPQMRRAVLDSLVTQRLLAEQTQKARLTVGNEQLVQFIASVPSLQENGKFSKERYEALVAAQGMSKEMFEARLRQDMAMQQLMLPVIEAGITGQVAASRWLATQVEQREIAEARLMPEAYTGRVKLAADAVQKYYESNRKKFELPEQVRAEFLVLSRDAMIMQASVSDEEARAAYQSRADRYKDGETRRASHILIRAAKDAPEAEAKAAKAKAGRFRQDCQTEFAGSRFRREGRRSGLVRSRGDGQGLRGHRLCAQGRTDFGCRAFRFRLSRDSRDGRARRAQQAVRRGQGRTSGRAQARSRDEEICRSRGSFRQHRVRTVGQPEAGGGEVEAGDSSVAMAGERQQTGAALRQSETGRRAVQRRRAEEQTQQRGGRSRAGRPGVGPRA